MRAITEKKSIQWFWRLEESYKETDRQMFTKDLRNDNDYIICKLHKC